MTKYAPDGTKRPWWWLGDSVNWWFFGTQLPLQVYFLSRSVYRGFDHGWSLADVGFVLLFSSLIAMLTGSFFGTRRILAAEARAAGPVDRSSC